MAKVGVKGVLLQVCQNGLYEHSALCTAKLVFLSN